MIKDKLGICSYDTSSHALSLLHTVTSTDFEEPRDGLAINGSGLIAITGTIADSLVLYTYDGSNTPPFTQEAKLTNQSNINAAYGVAFDSSGTLMAVVGNLANSIVCYRLNPLREVSALVNQVNLDAPRRCIFNSDGDRIVATGIDSNTVVVYSV